MKTIGLALLCFSLQGLPAPPRPAAPATGEYLIGPKDVIAVTVYGEEQLARPQLAVDEEGMIDYPLIGLVKVAGLTVRQVEVELTKRLGTRTDSTGRQQGYLVNPDISVTVREFHSQKIWVQGQVRNPGMFELKGGATLMNAFSAENAGALTAEAGSYVLIIHAPNGQAGPASPDPKGSAENEIRVSRRDIDMGLARTTRLRDGDTVYVPPAEKFFVDGEVKSGGTFVLTPDITNVRRALVVAGGVTDRGATNRISIRRTVNGKEVEIKVKESDPVKPGDAIHVPRKRI